MRVSGATATFRAPVRRSCGRLGILRKMFRKVLWAFANSNPGEAMNTAEWTPERVHKKQCTRAFKESISYWHEIFNTYKQRLYKLGCRHRPTGRKALSSSDVLAMKKQMLRSKLLARNKPATIHALSYDVLLDILEMATTWTGHYSIRAVMPLVCKRWRDAINSAKGNI